MTHNNGQTVALMSEGFLNDTRTLAVIIKKIYCDAQRWANTGCMIVSCANDAQAMAAITKRCYDDEQ